MKKFTENELNKLASGEIKLKEEAKKDYEDRYLKDRARYMQ